MEGGREQGKSREGRQRERERERGRGRGGEGERCIEIWRYRERETETDSCTSFRACCSGHLEVQFTVGRSQQPSATPTMCRHSPQRVCIHGIRVTRKAQPRRGPNRPPQVGSSGVYSSWAEDCQKPTTVLENRERELQYTSQSFGQKDRNLWNSPTGGTEVIFFHGYLPWGSTWNDPEKGIRCESSRIAARHGGHPAKS